MWQCEISSAKRMSILLKEMHCGWWSPWDRWRFFGSYFCLCCTLWFFAKSVAALTVKPPSLSLCLPLSPSPAPRATARGRRLRTFSNSCCSLFCVYFRSESWTSQNGGDFVLTFVFTNPKMPVHVAKPYWNHSHHHKSQKKTKRFLFLCIARRNPQLLL